MKVSVLLIDWSVRESFHSIHYLNNQKGVERGDYELIWVEYFTRRMPELEQARKDGSLDHYLVLGNTTPYYHKHVAWNEGFLASSGEVVVLCDSDAMFTENFISSIIDHFSKNSNTFLHLDEIRNNNKSLWPFSYPAWEEIMHMPGLTLWDEGHHCTIGLSPKSADKSYLEKLNILNYGACFCTKREDYLRFGGLDEHETYIGYICGPYDLTFRMRNGGLREAWHPTEFLLHTYHPWTSPEVDLYGPHIHHNSTTCLKHRIDGTTMPLDENEKIRQKRLQHFARPTPAGKPVLSVGVLSSNAAQARLLVESLERSTDKSVEVLFLAPKDELGAGFKVVDLEVKKGNRAVLHALAAVAQANHVLLVSAGSIFREAALDKVFSNAAYAGDGNFPLGVITTRNKGLVWYQRQQEEGGKDAFLNVVYAKNRLDEQATAVTPQQPSRATAADFSGIHLEVWQEPDLKWQQDFSDLLQKVLRYEYKLNHTKINSSELTEAELVLQQVVNLENTKPGSFTSFWLDTRYNLIDLYRFVKGFQVQGKHAQAISGLEMFARCVPILHRERKRLFDRYAFPINTQDILKYIGYFIGVSCFHLGCYNLFGGDKEQARARFEECLHWVPDHRLAADLLADMGQASQELKLVHGFA